MPRRLNYTNRKKIRREDVSIQVRRDGVALSFDADLKLAGYGFEREQPSPQVFLEAYRGASTVWKRFDFGRYETARPPEDRSLDEFGIPEGILFRVKISSTAPTNPGRLLGEADGIRPRLPDEQDGYRQPIIEHVPADDIGEELWRLDFSGSRPIVKINNRLPIGVDQFLVDPVYRAVFAPAVMRQVLTRALILDRDSFDEEDDTSWQVRWMRFASSLPGVQRAPNAEEEDGRLANLAEIERWIDSAVEAFVAASGLFRSFGQVTGKEAA